ncbi:MAG: type II toxin-antitoxin system PemK/MazF family toxin [Coriobacteriales bacterium]|jgi:mRNA interferase MazF|nr:type II toxin-antitoxin system PemK/MazF family toxin [Coriobacteriales bacterium]
MAGLEQGDIVWTYFDPTKGSEQSGRRPALIISLKDFNVMTGKVMVCPITTNAKAMPFNVEIDSDGVAGMVICEQVRTLDLAARGYKPAGKLDESSLQHVLDIVAAILGI